MIDLHYCKPLFDFEARILMAHELATKPVANFSDPGEDGSVPYCWITSASHFGNSSLHLFFEHVKQWLSEDSEGIISVHIESYLGVDGARMIRDLLDEAGIRQHVFVKPAGSEWPTLGEMRKLNRRVVFSPIRSMILSLVTFTQAQSTARVDVAPRRRH